MSKTYGLKTEFAFVRQDASRIIVSYNRKEEADGQHCTWDQVCFYKKQNPSPTLQDVKEAIFADINAETGARILSGFVWNDKPVWLSSENQFNFKAAYDLAVQTKGKSLPVKFKLGEIVVDGGEDEHGMPIRDIQPVYHTFEEISEFTDFYTKAISFINQCLNDGWELKDSIDWSEYERLLTSAEK